VPLVVEAPANCFVTVSLEVADVKLLPVVEDGPIVLVILAGLKVFATPDTVFEGVKV
jgi:hypothetical protein